MKKNHKHVIVIIGPTGSGKSTVAAHIHRKTGWPILSTGDIARQINTAANVKALKLGNLSPAEGKIRAAVSAAVKTIKPGKGLILDGFPRNVDQFTYLMSKFNMDTDLLLLSLDTSDWISLADRLMRRRRVDDSIKAINKKFDYFCRSKEAIVGAFYLLKNYPGTHYYLYHIFADASKSELKSSVNAALMLYLPEKVRRG